MDDCGTCGKVMCVGLFIVVIGLLASMASLEPLQYGITYSKVTKVVGTEVYESGRYLIGPFQNFIVYPASLNTVEFSNNNNADVFFFN